MFVWVVHRAKRAGMTAARQTKAFAMRLALDRGAGVEEARDDRRVDVRHIAFERRGAVHHRHPSDANVILDRDRLALELAAGRALNVGLYVPCVERVLLRARPISGRARIFDHRNVVRHLIDEIVSGEAAVHQRKELADAFLCHGHAEALDDIRHLFERRALHTHGLSPVPCCFWAASGLKAAFAVFDTYAVSRLRR